MSDPVYIFLVFFVASFSQSFVGFGLSMTGVPLIAARFGLIVAAPLLAIIGSCLYLMLVLYYRTAFSLATVWRLTLAAVIATPFGVIGLRRLPESILLPILGVVVLVYVPFRLFNFNLPTLAHPRWAFVFGGFAGLMSGAYTIAGPPVIIYCSSQEWPPETFVSNLQGFFFVNAAFLVIAHLIGGTITATVRYVFLYGIVGVVAGMLTAIFLRRFVQPASFQKIALVFLGVIGIQLLRAGG